MFKQDGQNQTSCQKPERKTIESSVRFLPDARKHGYVKIVALAGICVALGLVEFCRRGLRRRESLPVTFAHPALVR